MQLNDNNLNHNEKQCSTVKFNYIAKNSHTFLDNIYAAKKNRLQVNKIKYAVSKLINI